MRIALFHNVPSGGAKRYIYESTRRLVKNHKIDVYTLSCANHDFGDIRHLVEHHSIFDFTPRKLFRSPWGRLNQLQRWRDLGDLLHIGRLIAATIDQGNYDVVFAHTCLYTVLPAFLQFVQVPTLYYLHEPVGQGFRGDFQRPYTKNSKWREKLNRIDPLIKLYNQRLENIQLKGLRNTKQWLANSGFTQEQMKRTFGVDAPVNYCGVDMETFVPIQTIAKEHQVISVGELSARKGFDFIVKSLGHLPSESRPKLILVCNSVDALEKEYIKALAAQHGVDLQILPNVNNKKELATLYNKSRLCVYAPYQEPFGVVPLEAMACGTPVIGVREGGVQESVVHELTGLLVDRNPELFGAAIQKLLADPDRIETYGHQAREYVVQNWTWEQSVSILESHLEDCAFGHFGTKKSTLKEKVL